MSEERSRPVAFLTATCMLEGHPGRRADWWEHGLEFEPMRAGCAAHGIELRSVVWDDPVFEPGTFDAIVIGTTWDYAERSDEFVRSLERFSRASLLLNPLDVVRWNLSKTYLAELAASGVAVVPTLWCERVDAESVARAFDELGTDEVVAKPVVGASAWRQARLVRGRTLPGVDVLPPGRAMIQPFLPAAEREGELSFVFFGNDFSHCARKIPAPGDYRVQSMYGGHERPYKPAPAELATAHAALEAVGSDLLYARVDAMHDGAGRLLLMELELVEPYLYPEQGPGMGERFAAALAARLG